MTNTEHNIFEFERTFTAKPELAYAFHDIEKLLKTIDDIKASELSEKDIKDKMLFIKLSVSAIYSKVEELCNNILKVDIIDLPDSISGENIIAATTEIISNTNTDGIYDLRSDLQDKLDNISVLLSRLERAISDLDEDIETYQK